MAEKLVNETRVRRKIGWFHVKNNDCIYVEYHQKKKKKKENLMEEDERMARERLNNDSVLKESVTIVRGSAYYVRPVR